ncbi:A/G-specific adenine glycosylase [Deinococcus peraridilitoris]|uniref:Adenine DNA glycosylase n=1 Tax=Deinococcus peraridilitoris (strain DSM 19664 / LMG 22246 / CIP 109416 / KR-200) TaxID=937777 RepID=K9ZYN8_DEIPD|nr:A/G-specific adenine glycosylase [Deinococcus peraridilitoris]AFZ66691.1 A/G-specific adenine glycosylase [Deinococcus peraridilitoris DSM 19664]
MTSDPFLFLPQALLAWFDEHARDLPWRAASPGRRDPYRVWVSEVLLQQTQVVRGKVYFERFLTAFPDVAALATAPIEAVLKAWEGCGYYARARHLHRAAQVVVRDGFPQNYEEWLALPGIGPYTAAAITSIAYGEERAVNDGNVRRVLSRLHAEKEPGELWVQARADELLFRADPGRWNEALMDLGATVCTPKSPRCGVCPLSSFCQARKSGRPGDFPTPKRRAPVQAWPAVALLIGDAHAAYLEIRQGGLLGGLSGLPTEPVEDGDEQGALERLLGRLGARHARLLGTVSHTMTHRQVTLRVYEAQADLPRQAIQAHALSRLDHKALSLTRQAQTALFEM